ncbi:UDP-glucoronosyl and UDP-glucosyl transferase domain-containing protein [Phthorimaea operculella]|nr:UDP-glucoronosyl and UDP-glucosyl transferase domain-containing protein [Phthorimaea operculella]
MKERFGHDTPSLYELRNNIDMLFLNIHPIWDGNTPWPPSIVHTWGIHHKPEKLLPQDLQSYLDTSKNGVIYFSFGTNVDPATLPPERIQMFIRVFSKLPYDVLWKWNHDVLPGKTENIRISKWLPQSDLLRHPNVKVFITQGGLQSTDEAIIAGVPLIGIPMLADQWYNVEKYVHHGIGLKLSIETVNEEQLTNAIKEVIDNKRYRNNIKKLSAVMRDEPMSGLQRAVWWTEHVLRHGGARHLRAPAANISWGQYLELELDLQSYLDNSKNGVIYFSFGTNVDPATLPPERIQMFIRVFSKLPYDVLWKWNHDVLPGKTENIRISKWLPQSDLLRHPNVKVFITQGGLQSTDEAIIAGVPLIGIPILADQWYNVEKYVHHGIGLKLSIETVNEEQLTNAIKEVIDNKRYRNNIKKLSAVMRDEPMSGLQRAVWWTEHVLRHGGARHLRAPAANISWAQYLELELVSKVLTALLVIIVLGFSVLKRCYGYISTISINVYKSKNH